MMPEGGAVSYQSQPLAVANLSNPRSPARQRRRNACRLYRPPRRQFRRPMCTIASLNTLLDLRHIFFRGRKVAEMFFNSRPQEGVDPPKDVIFPHRAPQLAQTQPSLGFIHVERVVY